MINHKIDVYLKILENGNNIVSCNLEEKVKIINKEFNETITNNQLRRYYSEKENFEEEIKHSRFIQYYGNNLQY